MANSETINLMAKILGKRRLAESAVSYLARCRSIPSEEAVMKALNVSKNTAGKIVAAASMSTQYVFGTQSLPLSNADIVAWYLSDMKVLPVENLVVLTLTSENTLIAKHVVATGSAGGVCVNYGEVYRHAIADQATGIIIAHNHPGGTLEVSDRDLHFTQGLAKTGALLNIRFLDSMVISRQGFVSIRRTNPEAFGIVPKENFTEKSSED